MAVALVAGLLVAGCGGGDDSETVSKAEFIKQAEAICDAENKRLNNRIELSPDVVNFTIDLLEAEIEQMSAMTPESGQKQLEEMYDHMQKTIDEAEKTPNDIIPANFELAKAEKISKEYGMSKVCLISD